jgi:hypothetical protein
MPVFSGSFATASFAEILRMLVNTKQSGYLNIRYKDLEGFLAVENGVIINAKTGSYTGLHALFQFVVWREADFEFQEKPVAKDLLRDLSVYEPQVLITGVATKVDELAALQQAIPSVDSILYYVGGEGLNTVEATPADLGLLILADGNRTVRDIAERTKLNPLEVMRSLARFRLAGVLELVTQKVSRSKSEMAAAG